MFLDKIKASLGIGGEKKGVLDTELYGEDFQDEYDSYKWKNRLSNALSQWGQQQMDPNLAAAYKGFSPAAKPLGREAYMKQMVQEGKMPIQQYKQFLARKKDLYGA